MNPHYKWAREEENRVQQLHLNFISSAGDSKTLDLSVVNSHFLNTKKFHLFFICLFEGCCLLWNKSRFRGGILQVWHLNGSLGYMQFSSSFFWEYFRVLLCSDCAMEWSRLCGMDHMLSCASSLPLCWSSVWAVCTVWEIFASNVAVGSWSMKVSDKHTVLIMSWKIFSKF